MVGAALVCVVSLVLSSTVAAEARASGGSVPERRCPGSAHVGTSERAANVVVGRFLRTAVVRPALAPRSCVVSASDARPAAFQFLLELHGTRWLVSSFEVAPGSAEIDTGKMPT